MNITRRYQRNDRRQGRDPYRRATTAFRNLFYGFALSVVFFAGRCSNSSCQHGAQLPEGVSLGYEKGQYTISTPALDIPLMHVDSRPRLGSLAYRLENLLLEDPQALAEEVQKLKLRYGSPTDYEKR